MKTLTVRLPEALVAQIEAESRRRKLSKSDVVRERLTGGEGSRRRRPALLDAIADVVDTGSTLRKAGLEPLGEVVLNSTAVLVRRSGAPGNGPISQLVRRLNGVLVARQYVMLAYDVHADKLDAAVRLTPGIESPTISPLHREGWVAVQAMVLRAEVHKIMDELYEVGARAILVTDIHACRL